MLHNAVSGSLRRFADLPAKWNRVELGFVRDGDRMLTTLAHLALRRQVRKAREANPANTKPKLSGSGVSVRLVMSPKSYGKTVPAVLILTHVAVVGDP